jgi:hypothetical protein
MNDLKFNNLLKIKLNVEGDSGDKYNIPFNPRMLFYDKIPATINTDGLLLSDTINMASGQSSSSRWQQPGSSQENECPNDNLTISDTEVLKKNLIQPVNRVNDKNLQSFFNYRNSRSSYGYSGYGNSNNNNANNNGQIMEQDKINKNIKFITCLFFKIKQTFLRLDDNSIYLITNCRTSDYDINNVEHTPDYDRIYNITLNLTLLDVFKPAYLILKINYLDLLTKKQQTTVFLPSMNEPEITDLPLMENKEVSVLFSPFIELDQSFIATPTKDKKKIFLNKVEMTNWIIESFRKNKKLYTWEDYKRKVLNNNLRFLKQVFFLKDSPLDIEDKEYKVEKVLDNNSSQNLNFPIINTNNELVLEYTYTLTLKDTTKNELINLDIKLQIDNSLLTLSAKKKLNKTLLLFTPRLTNKNIPVEDNKVFFIPYLEIPPVYQLKKLNENIMRLFTVPTEFLKLVAYLKEKNQNKKPLDLKNPADKAKLDVIVNKNIERMLEIFLQPNGELYLDREVMNTLDTKTPIKKEEKKFFISRTTLVPSQTIPPQQVQSANKLYTYSKEVNDFLLPLRYAIEVKIELAENKLMLLDFYKLACKDKTKGLDEKIDQVILSAYPNEPITKPSTFFTDLMKPDQPYETLNRMRPALISTTTTGGTGKRKRGGVIIKKGRVTYRKAVNKRNNKKNRKNRKTRKS